MSSWWFKARKYRDIMPENVYKSDENSEYIKLIQSAFNNAKDFKERLNKYRMTNQIEVKINVPDGYEIDKENSTFECVKFKPIKAEVKLPKTWAEFCYNYPTGMETGYYIAENSTINEGRRVGASHLYDFDRNLLPTEEAAEVHLVLMQLHQLVECYRKQGGEWGDDLYRIYVNRGSNDLCVVSHSSVAKPFLSFQTEELA